MLHCGAPGEAAIIGFYPVADAPFVAPGAPMKSFPQSPSRIRRAARQGLLYTGAAGALVAALYVLVWFVGNALSKSVVPSFRSLAVVAGGTLLLGLLFNPLRRRVERHLEARLAPARRDLRERLIRLARELPGLGNVPAMAQRLTGEIGSAFGTESAALLVAEPNSGLLVGQAATRALPTTAQPLLLSSAKPGLLAAAERERPVEVARLRREDPDLGHRLTALEIALLVPVVWQGELVAVLLLGPKSDGEEYAREEKDLLNLFSHHVASVLEGARLFESAVMDSLTGLNRREPVVLALARELRRAYRHGEPLSVLMVDVDSFKGINDDHGHLAGDLLLRTIARAMLVTLRSTDRLARYGGDEFLIVLPETDAEGALTATERLRSEVGCASVRLDNDEVLAATISVGVATLPAAPPGSPRDEDSPPADSLIAAADEALYRAKGAGRDCVRLAAMDTAEGVSGA